MDVGRPPHCLNLPIGGAAPCTTTPPLTFILPCPARGRAQGGRFRLHLLQLGAKFSFTFSHHTQRHSP